jgi:phosphatidylinositol alpha 1,6-mannosyltransferase
VGARAEVGRLAATLGTAVGRVRDAGADVLLVTPFMPRRPASRLFETRFAAFADGLRDVAREHGAMLLDVRTRPELIDPAMWAEDRVHLNSAGHRVLAYEAAQLLGVRDASELGALEQSVHDDEGAADRHLRNPEWIVQHAAPWIARRMRGRTAGDGRSPKHDALTRVLGDPDTTDVRAR